MSVLSSIRFHPTKSSAYSESTVLFGHAPKLLSVYPFKTGLCVPAYLESYFLSECEPELLSAQAPFCPSMSLDYWVLEHLSIQAYT